MPRRRRLPARFALLLVVPLMVSCTVPSTDSDPTRYAADLKDSTNTARAEEDLPPLAPSSCAHAVAAERAAALTDVEDLTHAPMDAVLTRCGVGSAGENLSRSDRSADAVVEAWMDSSGHRANVLDPTWTHVAVACVTDGDSLLCSQVFLGP